MTGSPVDFRGPHVGHDERSSVDRFLDNPFHFPANLPLGVGEVPNRPENPRQRTVFRKQEILKFASTQPGGLDLTSQAATLPSSASVVW